MTYFLAHLLYDTQWSKVQQYEILFFNLKFFGRLVLPFFLQAFKVGFALLEIAIFSSTRLFPSAVELKGFLRLRRGLHECMIGSCSVLDFMQDAYFMTFRAQEAFRLYEALNFPGFWRPQLSCRRKRVRATRMVCPTTIYRTYRKHQKT